MEIVIVRHWPRGVQACMEIVECAALVRWCLGAALESQAGTSYGPVRRWNRQQGWFGRVRYCNRCWVVSFAAL